MEQRGDGGGVGQAMEDDVDLDIIDENSSTQLFAQLKNTHPAVLALGNRVLPGYDKLHWERDWERFVKKLTAQDGGGGAVATDNFAVDETTTRAVGRVLPVITVAVPLTGHINGNDSLFLSLVGNSASAMAMAWLLMTRPLVPQRQYIHSVVLEALLELGPGLHQATVFGKSFRLSLTVLSLFYLDHALKLCATASLTELYIHELYLEQGGWVDQTTKLAEAALASAEALDDDDEEEEEDEDDRRHHHHHHHHQDKPFGVNEEESSEDDVVLSSDGDENMFDG